MMHTEYLVYAETLGRAGLSAAAKTCTVYSKLPDGPSHAGDQ